MRGLPNKLTILLVIIFISTATLSYSGEVMPRGGQSSHLVEKGDTLWNISQDFYNDPFLWPLLWSRNPEIKNPHLIEPPEKINLNPIKDKRNIIEKIVIKKIIKKIQAKPVKKATKPRKVVKKTVVAKKTATERQMTKKSAAMKYKELVDKPKEFVEDLLEANRLSSVGYLTYSKPDEIAIVEGGASGLLLLTIGTELFIDEGREIGLNKGDIFSVISYGEPKVDKRGRNQGYVINILGEVMIEEVLTDYKSRAKIVRCYDAIERGNFLIPLFEVDGKAKISNDIPEVDRMKVVAAKNDALVLGSMNIVYLNKGSQSGIQAGNTFDVYRDSYFARHPRFKDSKVWLPEEKVGEVTVVYTTEDTSTAVVSSTTREIMLLDDVKKSK